MAHGQHRVCISKEAIVNDPGNGKISRAMAAAPTSPSSQARTARFMLPKLSLALMALLVAGLTVMWGCNVGPFEFKRPATAPLGYETSDQSCDDGLDNDQDGLVDCDDPDCIYETGHCGLIIPPYPYWEPENSFKLCIDQLDNDDDGQFDCGDRKCQSIPEVCCSREFTNDTCKDGIDNDGNGYTDCFDFGCRNGTFVNVCVENTDVLCSNGKDDDGDGFIDCADKNCSGATTCGGKGLKGAAPVKKGVDGPENSVTACGDGYDNDGNGYTDCGDFSCSKSSDAAVVKLCAESKEDTLARCKDGKDNDSNGYTDCNDNSCKNSADTTIVDYCDSIGETTLAKCKDGIDNDSNGYTDCNDNSCKGSSDFDIFQYCQSAGEGTLDKCKDGIDNDKNGYTDCNDNACSKNGTADAVKYCGELLENTEAECTNGKDDDKNKYSDCSDRSCEFSLELYTADDKTGDALKTVADYCKSLAENTWDKCKDGVDNDDNGYADCQDRSCRGADAWDAVNSRHPCQESFLPGADAKQLNAICSDGKDNDGDGFTDCADWDCAWNPEVSVCDGKPKVCQ